MREKKRQNYQGNTTERKRKSERERTRKSEKERKRGEKKAKEIFFVFFSSRKKE